MSTPSSQPSTTPTTESAPPTPRSTPLPPPESEPSSPAVIEETENFETGTPFLAKMASAQARLSQRQSLLPPESLSDDHRPMLDESEESDDEGVSDKHELKPVGGETLVLDPGKPEHWSAIETRSAVTQIRRQSARLEKKNQEEVERQQQLQQDQPGVHVCGRSPADQKLFAYMAGTTRDALNVADQAIVDSVTEIRRLTDQHAAAMAKLQAEIGNLKDQLAAADTKVHRHLDTIVHKLDSNAAVTNATYKMVVNSTAALNELIRDTLGIPIFKKWVGWATNLWYGDIPDDSNYFFPSGWLQWMEPQWPMSVVTHILTWLTAFGDNRVYSRFAKRFNVHVAGKFRVFNSPNH